MIQFIKDIEYSSLLRLPYINIAHYFLLDNDPKSAWEWFKILETLAEANNDQRALADVLIKQGLNMELTGDLKMARQLYQKNLDTLDRKSVV